MLTIAAKTSQKLRANPRPKPVVWLRSDMPMHDTKQICCFVDFTVYHINNLPLVKTHSFCDPELWGEFFLQWNNSNLKVMSTCFETKIAEANW